MSDVAGARRVARDWTAGLSIFNLTLVPLVMVLAIGVFISDLVLFAISANPSLNLAILGIALIASVYALVRAKEIDAERIQIVRSNQELSRPGEDLLKSQVFRGDIGRALQKLTISAKSDGQRTFTIAIDREMDILRSAMFQRLAILQYSTGLLISLGLLGTFLGLLRTLVSSSEVLEAVGLSAGSLDVDGATDVFSAMILSLKAPLTNMGTAFSSSLFGLVGSIMVGVMVLIVQRAANANITAFRDMVMDSRMRMFDFRIDDMVDAVVVQDIIDAMLDREKLSLEKSARILERVGGLSDSVGEAAQALEGFARRMDQAVSSLEVLPEWCRRNDGLSQALGETAIRIDGIEQVLSRQNEIMESLAYRQGQSQARMDELLSRLVEQQEVQLELTRGDHLRLDRLQGEAIENRRQLEGILVSVAATAGGVTRIAERIEGLERVAQDLPPTIRGLSEQVIERLSSISTGILAISASEDRSIAERADFARDLSVELGQLREELRTLGVGTSDLMTTLDAVAQKFVEELARMGTDIVTIARSHGVARAAFENIGTQILTAQKDSSSALQAVTTDLAEILEHLARFEPELMSRSDALFGDLNELLKAQHGNRAALEGWGARIGEDLRAAFSGLPELLKAQTATVERIETGNRTLDMMALGLGHGVESLRSDIARLVASLDQGGPYLSAMQSGMGSLADAARTIEAVLGALSEIQTSTRSITAIEMHLGRLEEGIRTAGDLNETVTVSLRELVSSINAQETALESLAENVSIVRDVRSQEYAGVAELRQELERLRAHLERAADREIQEMRKLGTALEAVTDVAATARLGLVSQEDTGRSLTSLLEEVSDIRSLDRSMLETARASREDISRLVSALDLFAENDRSRSALLERMTAIVAELRLERQREDSKDIEVRTDYERLRRSLAGIEGTLGLFMKRLERYLGREDKE